MDLNSSGVLSQKGFKELIKGGEFRSNVDLVVEEGFLLLLGSYLRSWIDLKDHLRLGGRATVLKNQKQRRRISLRS